MMSVKYTVYYAKFEFISSYVIAFIYKKKQYDIYFLLPAMKLPFETKTQ
jgi:hypothetical protein